MYFSMDGVFLRKYFRRITACGAFLAAVWLWNVFCIPKPPAGPALRLYTQTECMDRQTLKKLKSDILKGLQEDFRKLSDADEAAMYLEQNLPKIQKTAEQLLARAGLDPECIVRRCSDVVAYTIIPIPAGFHDAFTIEIGK